MRGHSQAQLERMRQRHEAVLAMNAAGATSKEIEKALNIHQTHVSGLLKLYGRKPNHPPHWRIVPDVDGNLKCIKCGYIGPADREHFKINIIKGKTVLIGVCRVCARADLKAYRSQNVFKRRVQNVKSNARKDNIPFNLTEEYLLFLWGKQKGFCFYTDEIMNPGMISKTDPNWWKCMTVDKIYPEEGYVIGNVVLCTYQANVVKNNLTLKQIEAWLPGWYDRIIKFICEDFMPAEAAA